MKIDVTQLGRVFGDRLLVRHLARPKRRGGLFVPVNFREQKKGTDLWYGELVAFGLDSRAEAAYALKVGDVVGFDALGSHATGFIGSDDAAYSWVPEEFAACVDRGRIRAYYADQAYDGVGLAPLGDYAVVVPIAEETSRGGIQLPQNVTSECRRGVVAAVGPGAVRGGEQVPPALAAETEVLVGKYAGGWARLGPVDYLLVKAEDVVAELQPVAEVARA